MKKVLILLLLCNGAFAQVKKDFTLEDIFKKGTFVARKVYGLQSLHDGKTYVSIETDPLTNLRYVARNKYSDGKQASILYRENELMYKGEQLPISTDFNAGESKVLISAGEEPVYRRSTKANYFVYDITAKKITQISDKGKQQYATFSPDGNKVAFVRNNNLFIKDLVTGNEQKITTDGKINKIINGGSDWVYEEEFSFAQAFYWSADSKKIAYYKFDESLVPEYSMTMYDGLYPTEYRYKYPKAGERNATVSIHVYNLDDQSTKIMDVGPETDQYIPRIRWTADVNTLCILRMNRHQSKLDYLLANVATGTSKVIMTEEDRSYIDINDEKLTFLNNGKEFINVSERDGYNHIYLYDMNGKIVRQITKGNWDVTDVYGVDEKRKLIYYQSAENSPLQRDIYAISFDGKTKKRLSNTAGTNDATFSADFSYFILKHSTANSPATITINTNTGQQVRMLEDNAELRKKLKHYNFSSIDFFTFKNSENVTLNGYVIKPADFSPGKKYPVLLYVYGGPGSQLVADSWGGVRNIWLNYMAQKGYIIACVDGRGTGFRGAVFKKVTYKNLGHYETIDQIEAAKWLGQQSYVDASRIGIWGWSFGGYMSSLCITKGADVFKMAIAVAPVTTWRYYDSIYTERYLQTPQENPDGYDNNSPINFASKLKGKFLLIHGTGDDNVHFQNSVMFSEALIQANKPFEQAYYPNKTHSISGGNTTLHLYSKMSDFILKNL
ncbi:S9 family peptidase [Pedobacter sp. BS3]|uniref:S9 family peptidase n=1 Tax=Pedobacter sp. BS3 TaxID=2567937 RepID=UPI0011F09963|nr:S9 family peptidase [Pedobacter sp. BS3]TZF81507.1 S9 family peptidase [Pedobacter sp. BS3]